MEPDGEGASCEQVMESRIYKWWYQVHSLFIPIVKSLFFFLPSRGRQTGFVWVRTKHVPLSQGLSAPRWCGYGRESGAPNGPSQEVNWMSLNSSGDLQCLCIGKKKLKKKILQCIWERHNSLVMCWKEMTHFISGLSETNVLLIFMQL